jgi:hypothetical protein
MVRVKVSMNALLVAHPKLASIGLGAVVGPEPR